MASQAKQAEKATTTTTTTATATASEMGSDSTNGDDSLKLAVAISLLRSKKLLQQQQQPPPPPPPLPPPFSDPLPAESDALRWKQKAKERKQEILRLKEDLKAAEECSNQFDLFPNSASCKCYFFNNLGKLSPEQLRDRDVSASHRFNDVLRRRFLRQVRLRDRKRRRADGANPSKLISDGSGDEEVEQLSASVDFLVELCNTATSEEDAGFANWSHQAVDFILEAIKSILSMGRDMEIIEGIVSSLITRLVGRMCSPTHEDGLYDVDNGIHFPVQHLLRMLGSEPYIGQRILLSVSQRICVAGENLLFMNPFDYAFPRIHESLFLMIELTEFLILDYLSTWPCNEVFDNVLFEEWVASVRHARKTFSLIENRNGLYVLYMDRVIGELAKQVHEVPSLQKINQEILEYLFSTD